MRLLRVGDPGSGVPAALDESGQARDPRSVTSGIDFLSRFTVLEPTTGTPAGVALGANGSGYPRGGDTVDRSGVRRQRIGQA